MSTKKVRVSVNISTENNGVVKIAPIEGIVKARISSIIFKHGARKKSRSKPKKKKKRDDSDSDSEECRFENGNSDLMESLYLDVLVNNFVRGKVYYYDNTIIEGSEYTVRIPLDLEYDGTGDYFKDTEYDWEVSPGETPHTLNNIDFKITTDKLTDPKVYDMLIELEFEVV
jgi:hypothetical protein